MKKTLWILIDDRRGSVGQAQGIAQAIGDKLNIIEKKITYNKLAALPNWMRGRSLLGINKKLSDNIIKDDYPDIVMSISRRTVPVARYIKKHSNKNTKIVQLMYPDGGVGLCDMDMVVVPAHDELKKQQVKNAFVIFGAPTRITPEVLSQAKKQWEKTFSELPRPYTAVIVGGAIKGKKWSLENAEALANNLKSIHEQIGGSILITTSRRTGEEAQNLIMNKIANIPAYTYIWGEKKDNPLMGFYACADLIVATADSVSMCSESCGTGVPVLLFKGKDWLTKKHLRFCESLINGKFAIDIDAEGALNFKPSQTLNSASDIAKKILDLVK